MIRQLYALSFLLVLACSNPARDKPVAEVKPAAAATSPTDAAGTRLALAPDSKLEFTASKVTRSHQGGFKQLSGTINLVGNTPEQSQVTIDIVTDSIYTDTEKLTGHLKTPDFFDVAKFPTAHFQSTSIVKGPAGYNVSGDLTLHGVTRNLTFPAQIEVTDTGVSARAEFVINRMDFGLVYPGKADDLIRNDVVIKFDIKANRT